MDTKNEKSMKKQLIFKEIGKILSSRRKESRKKIDRISKVLKIRPSHLIAIEKGSEDYFSEEIYQIGFIKTYAKYLKIDLSDQLNFLVSGKKNILNNYFQNKLKVSNPDATPNIKTIVSAISIMIILFFSLNEYKKTHDPEYFNKLEANNVIDYNESKVGSVENTNILNQEIVEYKGKENNDNFAFSQLNDNENIRYKSEKIVIETDNISQNAEINFDETNLKINFLFETWIQIFDTNNNIIKSGIFYAGEGFSLKIDDNNTNYFIDTGNSGGFEIISNNELLPRLGSLGEVMKKVSLIEILEVFEKRKKEN